MNHLFFKIALASALILSTWSSARPPEDAELRAAATLAERIADWTNSLPNTPKSIGIFNVFTNPPLDQDYSAVVEAETVKALKAAGVPDVGSCSECRAPQVVLHGEKLIIRKGTPDPESLEVIGERHPVEAFLVLDIYLTSFYIVGQATLYQNPSGAVIAGKRFEVPALKLDDAAAQILFTLGLGTPSGGIPTDTYSTTADVFILEEVGFGKAGLNLGAILAGDLGTLLYVHPTISFRGRFGSSVLTWTANVGAGFGLNGGSRGISIRGSYEVYLGSWAVMGLEAQYYLPDSEANNLLSSFIGVHLGFSIGR